jgi:uncharacterized membrane protein
MTPIRMPAALAAMALILCTSADQTMFGASTKDGEPTYTFVTLAVPGAVSTDAWDINNGGVIVGHYVADGGTHGFVRAADGTYYTIDVPGAVFTQATTISERNEIAGSYRFPNDPVLHAYLRQIDGSFFNIDVPGATSSLPRGSNKHSELVFEAIVGGHTTAYLLSSGAYLNVEPSPSFAGAPVTFSYASGINKHGAVVGRYDTSGTGARGFLLDATSQSHRDDAYTTLHFPNATSSAALGINKKGVIVGGYTKDGVRHGYVLVDDMYTTLDVPGCTSAIVAGAMTCTTPRKINDAGHIVGFYGAGGNIIRGFLATPE